MAFLNGPRLLDWASSPPYLQFNKFVLTGYRPACTVQECLRSLFYLHNELGNIYTHGSVLYHLFMNHEGGAPIYHTLLTLDMCGVCMVNTLGAMPIIYCSLLCYPTTRHIALLGYTLLSSYAIFCAVTAQSNVTRLQSFAGQAFFRFLFFFLRWYDTGYGSPTSLRNFLIMDALALLGGIINVARIPERWKPGKFDYWFNSHQIMHVLVVGSILHLHWGVVDDLLWIGKYQCPPE
ncbi:progestin and adipoQ receptor family member 4 isoform X2 [Latimeria chalumnae]|uniref:progestin and adipoQ receptor family member 4 isoform X2 n=1 Tax=Latimeria chalumnae TaxID=7897 RepID=UPI00313B0056